VYVCVCVFDGLLGFELGTMRECKRHVLDQPTTGGGGGVCTQCLQERLTLLWRGESFRSNGRGGDDHHHVQQVAVSSSSATAAVAAAVALPETSDCSAAQEGGDSSTVSVSHLGKRQEAAPNGNDDVIAAAAAAADDCSGIRESTQEEVGEQQILPGDQRVLLLHSPPQKLRPVSNSSSNDIKSIMEEWALLHANRRSKAALKKEMSKAAEQSSVVVEEANKLSTVDSTTVGTCDLRQRSHPLVDTIAKETALRVTAEEMNNKQALVEGEEEDGIMFGASEFFRDADELYTTHVVEEEKHDDDDAAACFSPARQGKLPKSNWVKVLVNPIISSSKVFPSKSREDFMAKVSQSKYIAADSESRAVAPPQIGHELKVAADESKPKRELLTMRHQSLETLQEPKQDAAKYSQQAKLIPNLETTYSRGMVEGIPDEIFQQEQTAMRMEASRNAVLLWLQDIPSPKTALFQKTGQLQVPPPPTDSSELRLSQTNGGMEVQSDTKFSTVDHSHEIVKESSQDTYSGGRIPFEMSSFQKFLVISTQKQMKNSTDSTTSRLVSEEYL
jgi:hypothetical protein